MSLRSIPLRWKLVAALVLPMAVVAGYLAVNVSGAMDERTTAAEQRDDVAGFVAVAAFSDSIGRESLAMIDRDTTPDGLQRAREATDAAMASLRSPELGLGPTTLAALEGRFSELEELRAVLGDQPFQVRLMAQTELRSGELTMSGEITPALEWLSALPSTVLTDAAALADGDGATAQLIDDYFLVQHYRADLRRELSTLLRTASLPTNLVDAGVTELVGTAIASTDQSALLMQDLASDHLEANLESVRNGTAITAYLGLRATVDAAGPGEQPDVDLGALESAGERVDLAFETVGNQTIEELTSRSSDTVFAANRELIISLLIGFWLLVVVGLLLRVLYRAVKSPIERLTDQARRISEVELPEVVEQMRRGDIDHVPHVEEIPAETKDEIGELVHAFNGMHRTAVELAAEQAASRRVVADMFVNLGRRNQRLVNRLLKNLTELEQHEEDPDKLASLYEVDHVATRMRRNAESLLVLAGAGQARRWDHPIPLYDLARAALAEVENYERVQIDIDERHHIDGAVVADLTHLLAELLENALSFSSPTSPVDLVARLGEYGLVVSVTDHGVGMTEERLAVANHQISHAAQEDETPSEFLGHYVVGRLAARHGIAVDLHTGVGGGVTANVIVPISLVSGPDRPTSSIPAVLGAVPAEPTPVAVEPAPVVVEASPVVAEATPVVVEASPVVAAEPVVATPRPGPQEPTPLAASLDEQAPRRRSSTGDAPGDDIAMPTIAVPAAAPEVPAVEPVAVEPVAAEPNPASFEWPSPFDIDPLTSETRLPDHESKPLSAFPSETGAPTIPPIAVPTPEPTIVPSEPEPSPAMTLAAEADATDTLNRAADAAVNDALSVFGVTRRTPGANLPDTDLFASISGSMSLGGAANPATTSVAPAPVVPDSGASAAGRSVVDSRLGDEDKVRFDLSGFQQGTARADREMGDTAR